MLGPAVMELMPAGNPKDFLCISLGATIISDRYWKLNSSIAFHRARSEFLSAFWNEVIFIRQICLLIVK
jgi:hypothetical protein